MLGPWYLGFSEPGRFPQISVPRAEFTSSMSVRRGYRVPEERCVHGNVLESVQEVVP